jgi:small subunit ribosomal protein S8
MSIDTIGNFLTIIRNGLMQSKLFVVVPYSKMREALSQILKEEGFIRDYLVLDDVSAAKKSLKIFLKYIDGESVIHEIERVSKPGRRRYAKITKKHGIHRLKPVIGGLGLSILTTSRGVISHKKARELGVGGEVICTVW